MKRLTSIFLVLAMLLTLAPMNIFAADADKAVFSDVKSTDYCAQSAEMLAKLNILSGYPDGTFGAGKSITRAEMAAVVCRMIGKESDAKDKKGKTDFEDVKSEHWASGYINVASKEGIINGDGNGKFRPEDNVKYEEAIKMIVCAAGYGDNVKVDSKDWSAGYIKVANEKGISDNLKGRKGLKSTRGDVAVMTYNGLVSNVAAPTVSVKPGKYTSPENVELETTTEGAEIYYTINGSEPTEKSEKYTEAILVIKTCTLKAIAVKDGISSKVMTAEYTLNRPSSGNKGSSSKPSKPATTTYTVSFDLNYDGATGAPKDQKIKKGEYAEMPQDPERENFIFVGWYVDGKTEERFSFLTEIDKSYTLVARWIDVTDKTDTDGEGLIDVLEEFYGTDKLKEDTDGDSLSDYLELQISLDPLSIDTDTDGINDGDEDYDNDGLKNKEELIHGTDVALADTDDDGLDDKDEIEKYLTNPTLEDTDNDGVLDGKEIELGTDPLTVQESFKMIIKSEEEGEVSAFVQVDLKGEQVETLSVEPVKDQNLFPDEMPGYMGQAYEFNVEGTFEKAKISFEFDASSLGENGDPTIYYFDEENQELEELPTVIEGNVASAEVTHFSKYILIDRKVYEESFEWVDVWESEQKYTGVEIVLVVDDSGSMGPQGANNDPNNTRLTVAKDLIEKLPQNSKIGVVAFDEYSIKLTSALTENKDEAKSYLNTTYFKSDGYSTYMYDGIKTSFSLFESNENDILKMMVVLSDGAAHDTQLHSSVIDMANNAGVKIYTVGLGNNASYFNSYLKPLADSTGGSFYLASNASQLAEIYKDISDKIDIETDSDKDGIPDYYEDNMVAFNGMEIKLDKNKEDTDNDGLLDNEEIILKYRYNEDKTKVVVMGRILSNPSKVDSDDDGFEDPDDKKPLVWDVGDRDLAMFAALTYESAANYNSGSVDLNYYFLNYLNDEELSLVRDNWNIVSSVKEWADINTYFEATTYKNGKSVVIAIRGTDEPIGEWVNNILGYGAFNWHVEESYAENYARKIAQKYYDCDIYITGHSLGGYLTQHAATELYEKGYSSNVKRIAYFNGMGLDTKFLFFNSMEREQKALKAFNAQNKLYCYKIKGDLVSALGKHFAKEISYDPTQAAIQNHRGKHGNTEIKFKLSYIISPSRALMDALKAGGAKTMEYIWYTHETDSFLYHLTQGTRNYK